MASDNKNETKVFTMRGNIPNKFILRPLKNEKHFQGYFATSGYGKNNSKESQDFDTLNELYNQTNQCSLMSIKNKLEKDDIVIDNAPIKLKLIGAYNQSYKQNGSNSIMRVLMPNGYAINMSTDVLLESIYKSGCDANGELKDNFIVISNGKNLTLVREQSGLHLSCLAYMEQMAKPKMSKMSFNVGSIYKTATGSEALFLGYITTLVPKISIEYVDQQAKNFKIKSAKYEYTNVKTGTLWYPVYYYHVHNRSLLDAFNSDLKSDSFMGNLKLVIGNAHSFVVQSERESIQIDNIIQVVHTAARSAEHYTNKQISFIEEQLRGQGRYMHSPLRWYQLENMTRYGKFANLELFGLKAKKNHLFNKIETTLFPKFITSHNSSGDTRTPV